MLAGSRPQEAATTAPEGPAVRRAPSHSLLGPALLLYLVADGASAQGQLDLLGAISVALAALLSLAPLLTARAELPGGRRVGWLGLAAACVLLRPALPHVLSWVVEVSEVLGLAASSALVLDLALTVPDRFGTAQRARALRIAAYGLGLLAASLGALSHAPRLQLWGRLWLAPFWLARIPFAFLLLGLSSALVLRVLRRRMGSSPAALASNAWSILGLVPAVAVAWGAGAVAWLGLDMREEVLRAAIVAATCALVCCHLWLVDPSRRLGVGRVTRNAVAATFSLAVSVSASVIVLPFWPQGRLERVVFVVSLLIFTALLYRGSRVLAQLALAPSSGRLLLALERAHVELAEAKDLQEVAKVVLGAARAASGSIAAEPILYVFDPELELRIDAAGQAHGCPSAPHPVLLAALRERPGELVSRLPLEAQTVRMPALRPLIEVVCGLDALCVLPLCERGEIEGALVWPLGTRRSSLTLEEIEALHRFGRHVTGFLAVLCAEARAWQRAAQAIADGKRAGLELEQTKDELTRLSAEVRALRLDDALAGPYAPSVAYSPAMRSLLERIDDLSQSRAPVLLMAERGLPLPPLARLLHHAGARAERPFVVAQCALVQPEQSVVALLGSAGRESPGWLALAADGTLLLCDVPALSADAQRALVAAMLGSKARIVASCRRDPDALVAEGVLLPELRERFPHCLHVPPLRERVEDLPSLFLIALDHSARVLGRPLRGLDPDAQARLLAYAWPGNLEQVQALLERAVDRCEGQRIGLHDLAALGFLPAVADEKHPLDGTLERVERRVLRRALERTYGNKSEAARLLGLKRTTFLDKLRRHGLDETSKPRASGAAPN
jgi:DNA-binding NtrC family response regulator